MMSTIAPATTATKWILDTSHSDISFKAKHLVITSVTGKFSEVEGSLETEQDNFEHAKITFTARTASLSTGNEHRDKHLSSPEFFDSANYPEIRFVSSSFVRQKEDQYVLEGDLTIRDVTRRIAFDVEYAGIHKDPFYGKTKAGFELNGKINRKDFGLQWDVVTEAGGAVVSNEIRIHCNIQLDRVDA